MASRPLPRSELAEALRAGLQRSSRTLLIAGIALIVLGSIAIIAPEVATLFVATFIGWLFIVSAVAHFYLAFQVHGGWRIAGAMLAGAVSLFAGAWLLVNPEVGAAALTLLMAAYFVATGVVKAIASFQLRHVKGWGWTFVSALASILLGCIVFSGWPGTATWAVGLLVGIDLLFYGWALIALRTAVNR
ncbi:MAG: HdeD family acid-resistance protein [Geminicoccaceae bacterium]